MTKPASPKISLGTKTCKITDVADIKLCVFDKKVLPI